MDKILVKETIENLNKNGIEYKSIQSRLENLMIQPDLIPSNMVFVDEDAFQTGRYGLYHMRKASCRPKASWVKPRYVQRLNVWGGISWNGPSKFVEIFILFFFQICQISNL